MPETILGLPTHVLVIHAVVVLVPLCAAGVVVMLVSPLWRERLRWPLLILLTGALASTFVARQTGRWLQLYLARRGVTSADIIRHANLGRNALWFVLAFWVLAVAWLYVDQRRKGGGTSVLLLGVLTTVAAVVATGWIVVTGHAGATVVYKGVVSGVVFEAPSLSGW